VGLHKLKCSMMLERYRYTLEKRNPKAIARSLCLVGFAIAIGSLFGCSSEPEPEVEPPGKDYVITSTGARIYNGPGEGEKVGVLDTDRGTIVFELYEDTAPNTVSNFCYLAGKGFYDGLDFYRVVPNFIIQTGDPKGDGTGGPEYRIPAEYSDREDRKHVRGTVSMDVSRNDVGTAGSRFFVCLSKQPNLDGDFPVLGKVIEGIEVLGQIEMGDRIKSASVLLKEKYLAQRESGK